MGSKIKNSNENNKVTFEYVRKKIWKDKFLYLLVAPYMILFTLFTTVPVLISFFLSFTHFNVLEPPSFIGFQNYIRLFLNDSVFIIAIKNTLILALITGPISYLLCLIIAWVINDLPPKLRAFVTFVFYAPSIAGNVYLVWQVIFSSDNYGYANSILLKLGTIYSPILFLKDPKYMMPICIAVVLWLSLGTSFLAFIAGLQGIDATLYEAGAVDGVKNRWQELWYITLPTMRQQLMFGAVMSITGSFGIGAVITGLVGFPSTGYAVHTIMHHLEDYGTIRFEMGYASSIATVLFFIMISANLAVKHMIGKVGE